MQEAKCSQPCQITGQIQAGGMPGLQCNCQPQHEKHQSINKIDDFVICAKEILDEGHRQNKL
jgi:hypothetical protein